MPEDLALEPPTSGMRERVQLLGVHIDSIPVSELIEKVVNAVKGGDRGWISYVNVHALNLAYERPRLRRFLEQSDLVFCDGHGVRLGAWLQGKRLPYRYTPPDWIERFARRCAEEGLSIFFLGGQPGVAAEAATRLVEKVPELRAAGAHHGYFDRAPGSEENRRVIAQVNESGTDVLIVGFGMPLQEYWIQDNWEQLECRLAFPVGAMFDYLTDRVYRAPRWITDNGLEWLARLIIEPRRLWKRYVVGNPRFLWRVVRERLTGIGPEGR